MDGEVRFCTTTDGVKIAYQVMGAGPPIVVPPYNVTHLGLPFPGQGTYDRLLTRHQLVVYDRRGTGLSERNISEMTPELLQLDLEAVINAAGLDRFFLYAHSLAGAVAIDYAAANPGRVPRIVFFGTSAATGDRPEGLQEYVKLYEASPRIAVRSFVERIVPDGGSRAFIESVTDYFVAACDPDIRMMQIQVQWHDQRPLLPRIQADVLVIQRKDDLIPIGQRSHELAELIPNARLLLLEGRDHIPTTPEQHEELTAPMLKFFAEADGETAANGAPPSVPAQDGIEPNSNHVALSPREMDVLRLVVEGKTNAEIAAELVVSPATVASHVHHILEKTGTATRAEATAFAVRRGLV